MNQFAGIVPGTRNSLVKLFDFNLTPFAPGDSGYTSNYAIIDTTIPSYINDGEMLTNGSEFAAGADGFIYETTNGGSSWTPSYNNSYAINKISFPDDENGYAIGDNGTIMKYTSPVYINEIASKKLSVYPNPASNYILVKDVLNNDYSITDIKGKEIQSGKTESGKIRLNKFSAGCYFITVEKGNEIFRNKIIIE